jgi:pimeloyl-ACP methyl ester carboxylesterase
MGQVSLPRFLQPSQSFSPTQAPGPVHVHAVYSHKRPFGQSQVMWWPWRSQDGSATPRIVLLFIPGPRTLLSPFLTPLYTISPFLGNPGLLDFYVPFLDAIYNEASSFKLSSVTIFAHAHLGLSLIGDRSFPDASSVTLPAQVQAHLEFFDELLAAYGPETSVLLVGHSIGAWFIQEILKARAAALLPRPRIGAFMLFPVISDIASSSAGKRFSVRTSTAVVPGIQYI